MMAASICGIDIELRCLYIRKPFEKECPDRDSEKCLHCKWSEVSLSGKDFRKLINVYTKEIGKE